MKIGLTLGKYAPLHLGHQLVIETALREMDRLYVLVYDSPEYTRIPLKVRSDWIRKLYPEVRVIEGVAAPADVGYTPEVIRIQDEYIRLQTTGLGITHFFSSEPYGEHVSLALGAINCQVDPGRCRVPVSATKIRRDPFAAREFIADEVYPDLITNFVFIGAPSTGKTTLVKFLAESYSTVWMPEYGAEYWLANQQNHRLNLQQLVEIARGHLEREKNKLLQARNILFTDTNVLTTCVFSHYYHGKAAPELEDLAQNHARRYDHYFLCDTDIPFADTWDRSGPASRETMQTMIIDDLEKRKIDFTIVRGSVEQRARQVAEKMQSGLFNKLF